MPTAVLVDGDFFLRRYRRQCGDHLPDQVARNLHHFCLRHLERQTVNRHSLYRIFFYDCPPLEKKAHNPITGRSIDFSKTPTARFRKALHQELRKKRKIALRLGRLNEKQAAWTIKPAPTKAILQGSQVIADLDPDRDIKYTAGQKGVDIRIGLDIASMCFKGQVDRIILISGDSDFVPASKLARREGVDFILDPMGQTIGTDLYEHIDGLQSLWPCQKADDEGINSSGEPVEGEPTGDDHSAAEAE